MGFNMKLKFKILFVQSKILSMHHLKSNSRQRKRCTVMDAQVRTMVPQYMKQSSTILLLK